VQIGHSHSSSVALWKTDDHNQAMTINEVDRSVFLSLFSKTFSGGSSALFKIAIETLFLLTKSI
jgi:hypothetical protein